VGSHRVAPDQQPDLLRRRRRAGAIMTW
jgi:hypothetical protein